MSTDQHASDQNTKARRVEVHRVQVHDLLTLPGLDNHTDRVAQRGSLDVEVSGGGDHGVITDP